MRVPYFFEKASSLEELPTHPELAFETLLYVRRLGNPINKTMAKVQSNNDVRRFYWDYSGWHQVVLQLRGMRR